MPGFNLKDFPFVVTSGMVSFNLINVNTANMETLINGSAGNHFGQQAFFFKEITDGFTMNFSNVYQWKVVI